MSSVINKHSKTAIVLFNLGGPDSLESVEPFLFNLFNDKAIIGAPQPIRYLIATLISKRRAPIAKEIYAQMGNKSPIVENTQAQADALEDILSRSGEVKPFICMRYWHPMSEQCAKAVKDYQPDHIILLPLYPQFSTTTTGSSLADWDKAAKTLGLHVPTTSICCYPTNDGFITAQAELIADAYEKAKAQYEQVRILFSAHGLPEKIVEKGDPYQKEMEACTQAIIKKLSIDNLDYVNCYQSRVGPLKWIGPSTDDEIMRAGADGVAVVLVPLAFVSEHSETLVELDIEYRHLADQYQVPVYERVPTVSIHPKFIQGLADICLSVSEQGFHCPWEDSEQCVKDEDLSNPKIALLATNIQENAA